MLTYVAYVEFLVNFTKKKQKHLEKKAKLKLIAVKMDI